MTPNFVVKEVIIKIRIELEFCKQAFLKLVLKDCLFSIEIGPFLMNGADGYFVLH